MTSHSKSADTTPSPKPSAKTKAKAAAVASETAPVETSLAQAPPVAPEPETAPEVKLESVKSSNLLERGYNPSTRELHVRFGTRKDDQIIGGKTYVHSNVSPEQWAHFIAAESAGKHYASTFRGNDAHPHRVLPEPKTD